MTREEAIFYLEKKENQKYIDRAINHENKIKLFSSFSLNKDDLQNQNVGLNDFMKSIRMLLNSDDSFLNFENNMLYPLQTNEFIESIFNNIKRIFQANDKYIDFEFNNIDLKQDASKYIKIKWFQEDGYNLFASAPNTIIVNDLPTEQISERPEPYFYPINISCVLDIEVCDNKIQRLIFKSKDDLIIAIDDKEYLVLKEDEKEPNNYNKLNEVVTIPHILERVPATFLNNKNLYIDNQIVKASPISKSLGEIEELYRLYVNKTIIDNYIVPYIVKYGSDGCDYTDGVNYCDSGILKQKSELGDEIIVVDSTTGKIKPCPVCSQRMGYADTVRVPTPQDKEEFDLAVNALKFISPETGIFEYSDKRIKEKESKIFSQVVGKQDLNPNQQQNELRVMGSFESRKEVLFNWKKPFENSILWVNNNTLTLRYNDEFLGGEVNLGTKFFLQTVSQVYEEKKLAEENGMAEIVDYEGEIIEAKYSTNFDQRNRSLLLLNLSRLLRPLNGKTNESVDDLYKSDKINQDTYIRFTEFYNWMTRFESERKMKITQFEYDFLVKELNKSFNKYLESYGTTKKTTE